MRWIRVLLLCFMMLCSILVSGWLWWVVSMMVFGGVVVFMLFGVIVLFSLV